MHVHVDAAGGHNLPFAGDHFCSWSDDNGHVRLHVGIAGFADRGDAAVAQADVQTGLDYYRDGAPRADQQRAFEAQIELARSTRKPLVIHTREAADDTLTTLREHAGDLRVILHCFSMPERIEECLAQPGWLISFAGNLTYPKADALRAAAVRVPADRLLVETDAPFLSPQPVRGKRNQPAYVVHTATALAVQRRVGYGELEAAVQATAVSLFKW